MNTSAQRRWWQFSLRGLLFAVLIVGPIAGVAVPIVWESITEWKPPPRPRTTRQQPPLNGPAVETESYYESGETPLY